MRSRESGKVKHKLLSDRFDRIEPHNAHDHTRKAKRARVTSSAAMRLRWALGQQPLAVGLHQVQAPISAREREHKPNQHT